MKTILHLDADAFFASVEQGLNPKLMGRPVVVGGLAHQRGCVHTASYEARRKGVKTGMALRIAKELCPDAVFLKGDFRHYRAAGLVIERIVNSYTPDFEFASIDDVYADLSNLSRLYKSPVDAAKGIQRDIKEQLKIGVSIGIASSKLIAGIASKLNKPGGITYVPPGMEQKFLSVLPVRMLRGIGRKTEMIFNELGINTIGGLTSLPKDTVLQLLGSAVGDTIWQYAHANDTRPVQLAKMPKQISRETSFEEDVDDEKLIIGTFYYLSERIAAKLRENSWKVRKIHIKVYYADGRPQKQSATLKQRVDDGAFLSEKACDIYRGFPKRRVRIKLVGVTVFDVTSSLSQLSLFEDIEQKDNLNAGIDSVRKRFGFTSLSAGNTMILQNYYRMEKHGYILHTPSLSQ